MANLRQPGLWYGNPFEADEARAVGRWGVGAASCAALHFHTAHRLPQGHCSVTDVVRC